MLDFNFPLPIDFYTIASHPVIAMLGGMVVWYARVGPNPIG